MRAHRRPRQLIRNASLRLEELFIYCTNLWRLRHNTAQFMPAPITMSMEYPGAEASEEYASVDVLCPDGQVRGDSCAFASVEWKAWIDEQ
jgi:hypothetical protein